MSFFSKFKTYFVAFQQESQPVEQQLIKENDLSKGSRKQSSDSFELILQDIMLDSKKSSKRKSQNFPNDLQKVEEFVSEDFQNLEFDNEEQKEQQLQQHEECHNMYVTGIVFINKYSQGREITLQEWNDIIQKQNLSLQSQKDIYFSILKGVHFSVRKKVWELLSNTQGMKTLTELKYEEMTIEELIPAKQLSIIDKDVPRTQAVTKYLTELRNILIAYVRFSGKGYTQGMNLIAGSLLEMLSYENDKELEEFAIIEESFEERVFWVFVGIMRWRNWEHVFEKDLSGLKEMLCKLEKLMVEYVPAVYQKIIDYDWDLTIFSQYYITILLYNTPKQFSKIILDLFLLDGENTLHSLVIRMLKLNEDTILSIIQEGDLMEYFKKTMIHQTFERLQKDKVDAKKLDDFQINFLEFSNV